MNYKNCKILKYKIGIAPSGLIIFNSSIYGGRASDKFIFNDCNIATLLEPGDDIMVDKGYQIEEELAAVWCRILRQPFLKNKKQFSPAEPVFSKAIAQLRVHVERAIQRIKIFVIMQQMLWELVNKSSKILTIICGLVNLSTPIIKY